MTTAVRPVLQSLLVADHVYMDAATGKKIIAGVFHELRFFRSPEMAGAGGTPQVPHSGYKSGSPFAYAGLTDVIGDQTFSLRYVDLADDRIMFAYDIVLKSPDRLKTHEIVIPLPPLPSGKAGYFALELLWGSEPLGSHRIKVVELPIPEDRNS